MTMRAGYRGLLLALLLVAGYAGVRATAGAVPGWLAACGAACAMLVLPVVPVLWLRWVNPRSSAMMRLARRRLSRDGVDHGVAFTWIDLASVSREMWLAAVAAEDGFFREHAGFDWESIRQARLHNRSHDRKRGGSTISQQVAKNLFLWPARSWFRKGLEAWLTMVLEACWPKRRILEVYLNVAQFGADVFGVEAAARRFFGKSARDLTRTDAALLAAALPSPVRNRVDAPSHQMRFRQTWVLGAMRRLGDLYLERI